MKTISFAVPCYNSAAYMDKCIESLLACGDDIEIIIVDEVLSVGYLMFQQKCERRITQLIK